ncbi:polysaccharide deacetylase family protein [Paenibacillus baekrokdamisoli]|uniref:Polysaccharide deacetylase family protein n=2 Tax=Paenibacillus baekrokdamisoli TaxID=1712516 RepID=A0A3G9JCI9_9BACL|nr:polysaccharide deacetylase family protein [Paenibacillus baekrokdamisoli]
MLVLLILCVVVYMLIPYVLSRVCGLGVYRRGKNRQEKEFAFTFDDGPDPCYTPELLDLLKQYGVKATFFVLGSKAERYPELIWRMHEEGHQIGIHNYTHTCNWMLTPWEVKHQHVGRTADIIERITGERPTCYRPPWGLLNMGDLLFLRKSYRIVVWSVMGWDWKRQDDAEPLTQRLLSKIKPGAIVLLHDSGDTPGADEEAPRQMLKALQTVLQVLQHKGYQYMRTDKLLEYKAVEGYAMNQTIHPAKHIKSRVYE